MTTDPQVRELLAPLNEAYADPPRRLRVDREKIVSHMVATSLAPSQPAAARSRRFAILAMAAAFALLILGGFLSLKNRGGEQATRSPLELITVRGRPVAFSGGLLEIPAGSEARLTGPGLAIDVLEGTRLSVLDFDQAAGSLAMRLDRGTVRCDVEHRPSRTLTIVTPDARVLDIGTIFRVSVQPAAERSAT
ncbi:MAG TPA: FecR domain-containing protein, partial [Polyangiaceae bacterium]|nr:FecR domain-containing protein [Polyangiaceae bacterium]